MSGGTTLSPQAWAKVATAINLVQKGLVTGHLPDAVLLDTSANGPSADMKPLSQFVEEAAAAMREAIQPPQPEAGAASS